MWVRVCGYVGPDTRGMWVRVRGVCGSGCVGMWVQVCRTRANGRSYERAEEGFEIDRKLPNEEKRHRHKIDTNGLDKAHSIPPSIDKWVDRAIK
eukprot:676095-Prorocentrum_minimum.AAC.1